MNNSQFNPYTDLEPLELYGDTLVTGWWSNWYFSPTFIFIILMVIWGLIGNLSIEWGFKENWDGWNERHQKLVWTIGFLVAFGPFLYGLFTV